MFTKMQATAMRSILDKDVGVRKRLAQLYQVGEDAPTNGWDEESLLKDDVEPDTLPPTPESAATIALETAPSMELSAALGSELTWLSSAPNAKMQPFAVSFQMPTFYSPVHHSRRLILTDTL